MKVFQQALFLFLLTTLPFVFAGDPLGEYKKYAETVRKVESLSYDPAAQQLAQDHGLQILNVTWEDTGRAKNSALGPNISDVTIQAHIVAPDGKIKPVAMPVIRYPNFGDKTADLSPNNFFVLVGNEKGQELQKITLTEYLDNFRNYLSQPKSWKGEEQSLLAARDTHVLVSAQNTLLPIPAGQKAHFNPVIFNYQSYKENPAVLAILATREGTSATIIDNTRDAFNEAQRWRSSGQRLFFNHNGQRASLTGERLADFAKTNTPASAPTGDTPGVNTPTVKANTESGVNLVLLIQVPLVYKERAPRYYDDEGPVTFTAGATTKSTSVAVIGHGPIEGPFTEIDNLEIKRDTRFPIRVTVQFYLATAESSLTEQDLLEMRRQIDRVYANADFVGSLVTEGKTGRPTEHKVPFQYPVWWPVCWKTLEAEYKINEAKGIQLLEKAYGKDWLRMTRSEEKFKEAVKTAIELDKKKYSTCCD